MKTKTCEHCGKEFGCSSDGPEACWCNEFQVTPEKLKELRKKYGNCLCERCLIEVAQAKPKKENA